MAILQFFKKRQQPKEPFTQISGLSPIMPPADLPERSPEAHKLSAEALVAFTLRQFESSTKKIEQALPILRRIGHRRAEVRFLYNLGIVQHALGKYSLAIATYRQGLSLAREIRPELAEEFRELAVQAEALTSITQDFKVIGVPDFEWQVEVMFLSAMAIAFKDNGKLKDADASMAEARRLLRESPRIR